MYAFESDPRSPSPSKYDFAVIHTHRNRAYFDQHCQREHIKNFMQAYVDSADAIVEDWCSRILKDC